MLKDNGVDFEYRDYMESPLGERELRETLKKLGLKASSVLRKRDPAYKRLGLTGTEPEEVLIGHLADNPTLLERPIGVLGSRAVLGRPPEKLLELVD